MLYVGRYCPVVIPPRSIQTHHLLILLTICIVTGWNGRNEREAAPGPAIEDVATNSPTSRYPTAREPLRWYVQAGRASRSSSPGGCPETARDSNTCDTKQSASSLARTLEAWIRVHLPRLYSPTPPLFRTHSNEPLPVSPSNTWASLTRLAQQYGEIFQIKVLGQTIVFIGGAALAEELCDETRFRKYVGGPIVEIRYAVHDALFTAYDDEESWEVAHRIVAPRLASREAVGPWCGDMVDCVEELIAKWRRWRAAGARRQSEVGGIEVERKAERGGQTGVGDGGTSDDGVLLIEELNRLNLEATTLSLFGKKLDCIDAREPHPMLSAMEDATSEAMKRPTRPGFVNWLLFSGKFRTAKRTMREEYAADLVKTRQQRPSGGADRKDVLDALMEGTDPQTGKGLTESQVIDEIVSMPIGSSTAPCLLASMVYLLLKNPACIQKARNELDHVLGGGYDGRYRKVDDGEEARRLGVQDLARLPYIEGIVRESLRLSAAAPGFNIEPRPRTLGKNDKVDKTPVSLAAGKYEVAHNQAMIVVLSGVNRDPSVFEEPSSFQPERMMGAAFEGLPAGVKKWYGNGKRECIGKHWAWQFMMVSAALLIRNVDFEMVDPGYEMHQDGWFNIRPVDFKVRPMTRSL